MITTHEIGKTFKNRTVLTDISVVFPASSVTAVVGPNGSGKSTLMKILLGLVTPTSGWFSVLDQKASGRNHLREQMGYMAQIARYPENLTVHEVVDMVRSLRPSAQTPNLHQLVDQFLLREHINKVMRVLSGGTRQKVGALLAFMFQPKILLLDEPTAAMDPIAASQIKRSILDAKASGCTIVVTSHLLAELQEIADRVVYLHEGRVVYSGTVDDLVQSTDAQDMADAITGMMLREHQA